MGQSRSLFAWPGRDLPVLTVGLVWLDMETGMRIVVKLVVPYPIIWNAGGMNELDSGQLHVAWIVSNSLILLTAFLYLLYKLNWLKLDPEKEGWYNITLLSFRRVIAMNYSSL